MGVAQSRLKNPDQALLAVICDTGRKFSSFAISFCRV